MNERIKLRELIRSIALRSRLLSHQVDSFNLRDLRVELCKIEDAACDAWREAMHAQEAEEDRVSA